MSSIVFTGDPTKIATAQWTNRKPAFNAYCSKRGATGIDYHSENLKVQAHLSRSKRGFPYARTRDRGVSYREKIGTPRAQRHAIKGFRNMIAVGQCSTESGRGYDLLKEFLARLVRHGLCCHIDYYKPPWMDILLYTRKK